MNLWCFKYAHGFVLLLAFPVTNSFVHLLVSEIFSSFGNGYCSLRYDSQWRRTEYLSWILPSSAFSHRSAFVSEGRVCGFPGTSTALSGSVLPPPEMWLMAAGEGSVLFSIGLCFCCSEFTATIFLNHYIQIQILLETIFLCQNMWVKIILKI